MAKESYMEILLELLTEMSKEVEQEEEENVSTVKGGTFEYALEHMKKGGFAYRSKYKPFCYIFLSTLDGNTEKSLFYREVDKVYPYTLTNEDILANDWNIGVNI